MMELEALPKGFRFRPTDQELISHYLRLKISGDHSSVQVIPEVDVCKKEPWDLPALSVIKSDDSEWFFFCPRDKKYPNGHRSNRATEAGYWKATGKDRTIKSRKSLPSGCSNTQIIGIKKTLVFHKGRAPKGERTSWIMHEYRATEPDLDGSGPGQGDYVLCRLFHKADVQLVTSNYAEVEPTESSPSTGKSSPDDVTSDLFQEPVALGMDIKELKDLEQWTYETDCSTSMMPVPNGRCESNVSGLSEDKATTEVYSPLVEIPKFEDQTNKVLNTFQSEEAADSGACIGSPFAYDFGYNPNGFHFQDGTFELDASFSELLKDLPTPDNNFYLDSTALLNCGVSKGSFMPEQTPIAFIEGNHFHIHDEVETQMAKSQYPNLEGQLSAAFLQVNPFTHHSSSQYASKEDWLVNGLMGSHSQVDDSFFDSPRIEDGSAPGIGSAIKIRSRQPRSQSRSVNIATQGTASRRIHLLMKSGSNSICSEKSKDANSTKEKESHPFITEVIKYINKTCKSRILEHEHPDETKVIPQAHDQRLKSPSEHGDKKDNTKAVFVPSSALCFCKGASFLCVYVVSIYFVIIMSVVSLGSLWPKCPNLSAPYD